MSDVRAKWLPRVGQTREQKTKWLQCSVCDCAVNRGVAKTFFLRSVFFVAFFHFVSFYLDKQDKSLSSLSVGTV